MRIEKLPIAIIGAGPVGMAAAAQLTKRNIPFVLFEAGTSIGQNLLSWSHIQVFSPWKYNMDKAAVSLLEDSKWRMPDPEGLPTGAELVKDYLFPLSQLPRLIPYIRIGAQVLSVSRQGLDKMKTADRDTRPFSIQVNELGVIETYHARAVIDSSGTWNQPNPIGSGGTYAEGELEYKDRIHYGIPDVLGEDRAKYARKNIAVIGSGHSAINVLLDLAVLQEEHPEMNLHWILRKENMADVYGGKEEDGLEARGALGIRIEGLVDSGKLHVHTPYHIRELREDLDDSIQIIGAVKSEVERIREVDLLISNTGSRPDLDIIREVRVDLDSALESVYDLAPLIDPNVHSCGTVRPHGEKELRQPEKDFYIVGSKSYGRAPTFLMATGYEQVRSVVAYLDGDIEAAERVELDLPETGVCSSNISTAEACC